MLLLANTDQAKEHARNRRIKQARALRDPDTPAPLRWWYRLGEATQTVISLAAVN